MKYERLTRHSDLGTLHACDINGKEQPLCELTAVDTDILISRLCILEDKIENGEIDYISDKDAEIVRLTDENAELRARLEKAVELPVKVGDTVYFIPTYNRKPIWGVQRGIVQMVGITRQGYHVKIRDRADFNKTYMFRKSAFLSKEQAEARLAKLKGEEKNG